MKQSLRNLLGLIAFTLLSCSLASLPAYKSYAPMRDSFYVEKFYDGDPRLPVIKPYVLFGLNDENWVVGSRIDEAQRWIESIKQIDVRNRVIYIYSSRPVYVHSVSVPQAWFVIQPDQQVEIGFKREDEFNAYLVEQGLAEPNWKDIQVMWETFRDTGELPWQTELDAPAKSP